MDPVVPPVHHLDLHPQLLIRPRVAWGSNFDVIHLCPKGVGIIRILAAGEARNDGSARSLLDAELESVEPSIEEVLTSVQSAQHCLADR